MKYQTWMKTIMTGSLALLVVGCGDPFKRESDPMSDYEDLRKDVPVSKYQESKQNFDGLLFDMQIDGTESGVLNFFEGKATSYKIQTRVFIDGVNYKLIPHNLPAGASLQAAADGTWEIKWAPALNTIPSGLTNQVFESQIEIALDQNSTARAREMFQLDRRNRVKKVTLSVNFQGSQPVLKVSGFENGKEFKVGEVVQLTLEVTDPNSSQQRKPKIVVDFDSENQSAETRMFPANNVIIHDPSRKDKFVGNGKWVIYRLLDTTLISAKYLDPRAKYEGGEFTISAINMTTKLDSINQLKRFKVKSNKETVL